MTFKEIASMIDDTKLPNAYYQFPDGTSQACPFICFYYPNRDDTFADNVNYAQKVELIVELYTDTKDFTTEAGVESVLTSAGLTFSKDENYIDSERMWQIAYSTEVYID